MSMRYTQWVRSTRYDSRLVWYPPNGLKLDQTQPGRREIGELGG